MDPNATLRALLEALDACAKDSETLDDRENAVDLARNLADWLEKGGFAPDVHRVCESFVEFEV